MSNPIATPTSLEAGELARLRELLAHATPRPWCVYAEYDVGLAPSLFAGVPTQPGFEPMEPLRGIDLDLVAEAINALPSILDELERLRALSPQSMGSGEVGLAAECAKVEADAVSGLRYIEGRYGRLDGVGWDRVFDAHDRLFEKSSTLSSLPPVDLKDEWLPIESAPKDTDVLLWMDGQSDESPPVIVAGQFHNGDEWGWSSSQRPDHWIEGKPTHWRPLPAPPVEIGGEPHE